MSQPVKYDDLLAAALLCALKKEKAHSQPQPGLYGLQPNHLSLMETLYPCPARRRYLQQLKRGLASG